MEPFYFGKTGKMHFGVYHPPGRDSERNVGVVLCYPVGQEYIRSHRAFLRLGILLASAGFNVLRFDYYGCGDSEGDFDKADFRQWMEGIDTAIDELQSGCDAKKMYLVGLRMGATMSAIAGSRRDDIDGVVLWEPIVNGRAHITELNNEHRVWLQGSFARPIQRSIAEPKYEVLGYPLSASLVGDIEKIDLLAIDGNPAGEILVIESKGIFSRSEFVDTLRGNGASVRYKDFPGTDVWTKKEDEMNKSMVPVDILQCIVEWITEVTR